MMPIGTGLGPRAGAMAAASFSGSIGAVSAFEGLPRNSRIMEPAVALHSSCLCQQRPWSSKQVGRVWCGARHGDSDSRLKAGGYGSWVRRKRRWMLVGGKASEEFLRSTFRNEGGRFTIARVSPSTASALPSSYLDRNDSSFHSSGDRLSVSNFLTNSDEEAYRSDSSYDPMVAQSEYGREATKFYDKLIGVQAVRGRFEVRLQKDGHAYILMFSNQKGAAKAYDKATYKLKGPSAKTNFELTEKERLHVDEMEWEDLLLEIQLQDLVQSSPSRLGFPGVCYKEQGQLWMVKIKHEKEAYVGYFHSMTDATKAYDLSAYKLQGRDALVSHPLTSAEKIELIHCDWEPLAAKLGLKVSAATKREVTEFQGVRRRAAGGYLAIFAHKGYYFNLGTFASKDAAAKAYDLFAFKLLGDRAKVNSELLLEEKEFLSRNSVFSLRDHLASQAIIAPKISHLGARGARLVHGQWEVYLENPRKDRIYTSSASNEQEAQKIHDMVVSKLHNGMGRTYTELTETEQEEVDSTDWTALASKFDLRQMHSYHGVNRLVSGLWQSYIRHGGAYLAIGTFDSADIAARCSDKCEYKRLGRKAILNFLLSDRQKREIDAVDWGSLIAGCRVGYAAMIIPKSSVLVVGKMRMDSRQVNGHATAGDGPEYGYAPHLPSFGREAITSNQDLKMVFAVEQRPSPVLTKLGGTSVISSPRTSSDKKWMLLLCHEQLLQQQMTRRAPKVGRQLVVANPVLAALFSEYNRRADESPMLIEEVMEGSNTPLLWQCQCGNIVLKPPMGLLRATQVLCKMAGCTAKTQTPRRMRLMKKSPSDSNGAAGTIINS